MQLSNSMDLFEQLDVRENPRRKFSVRWQRVRHCLLRIPDAHAAHVAITTQ